MTKIDRATVDQWKEKAQAWLAPKGHTLDGITTGRDAWTVAHGCGITEEAYRDREIHDAHIQTALEAIFPRALFKDAKRY